MNDMPEKIYLSPKPAIWGAMLFSVNPINDATPSHRDDIVKALEAQNKILAEAVLAFNNVGASHEIISVFEKHAEAIALAQRIGGKNDNR